MAEPERRYRDRRNPERGLLVKWIEKGDPLGREVIGTLDHPGEREHGSDYSCDLATFDKVWEDDDGGPTAD